MVSLLGASLSDILWLYFLFDNRYNIWGFWLERDLCSLFCFGGVGGHGWYGGSSCGGLGIEKGILDIHMGCLSWAFSNIPRGWSLIYTSYSNSDSVLHILCIRKIVYGIFYFYFPMYMVGRNFSLCSRSLLLPIGLQIVVGFFSDISSAHDSISSISGHDVSHEFSSVALMMNP